MALRILDILRGAGAISPSACDAAKVYAQTWGCSGYNALIETHIVDEAQLADFLAASLKVDRIYNVSNLTVNKDFLQKIPYSLALEKGCLPLNFSDVAGHRLEILFADPTDDHAQGVVQSLLQCELSLAVGELSDIVSAINRLYPIGMQLPAIS